MSRTCGQIIDETIGLLESYGSEPQSATLNANCSPTDLTLVINPTRAISTGVTVGLVEIGSELLFVDSVDSAGNATVPPWGRGYKGTTAAAHTAGARVVSQPAFPRAWVLQRLNEAIDRVYPHVFAVKSVELTTTTSTRTYVLPSDAEFILKAAWQEAGSSQYWRSILRWRMQPGGGTLFGDSGRSVDIADSVMPGRPIQFIYAAQPGYLVAETDDFATATGLSVGMADVVTLAAASRLVMGDELSRVRLTTVEQQNRAQGVPPGAAGQASRALEQQFQVRLMEEQRGQRRLYPARLTRTWN